jgi:hypothetical protein
MYDGKWKMGNGKLVRRSLGEGGRLVSSSTRRSKQTAEVVNDFGREDLRLGEKTKSKIVLK